MADEEITYYAIVGRGRAVDDPHGIVRRRKPAGGGVVDEALRRDLNWHRTGIIVEWEHSSFADELEEVSEERAMQLVETFRAGNPY